MGMIKAEASQPFSPGNPPDSMLLESVPTPNARLPEGAVSLFYGFGTTFEEIGQLDTSLHQQKKSVNRIEMILDGGEVDQISNVNNLAESRMMNLARMTKALESEVQHRWKDILKNRGYDLSVLPKDYWRNSKYLLVDTHLISDLRNYPEFEHIESIVYPYDFAPGKPLSRRIAVFSYEHMVSCKSMTYENIKIELPKLEQTRKRTMRA